LIRYVIKITIQYDIIENLTNFLCRIVLIEHKSVRQFIFSVWFTPVKNLWYHVVTTMLCVTTNSSRCNQQRTQA